MSDSVSSPTKPVAEPASESRVDVDSEKSQSSPTKPDGAPESEPTGAATSEIWRSTGGVFMSGIAFASAVAAFACQPTDAASIILMASTGAHCGCLVAGVESDIPFRFLNATSITAAALGLYPTVPTALPASFLTIAGLACWSDVVRVAAVESKRGKGIPQLVVAIPAIIGMKYLFDGTLYSYHPMLTILGGALMAVGVSVQMSGRQHWLHSALGSAACVAVEGGVVAIVANKIILGNAHFASFHSYFGAVAAAGILLQVALAIPTVWPGMKPSERKCVDLHHILGKLNLVLMSLAIVTGLAYTQGWTSTSTVLSMVITGGTTVLLITPAWKVSKLSQISL